MSSIVNALSASIPPSPTLAISERASALKRAGHPIINLSAGEPDTLIPKDIRHAAIQAIEEGQHLYTPVSGTPALKEAVAAYTAKALHMPFASSQVLIGHGGKQIIYNALMSSLEKGDEVLIPIPYWVSYPSIVSYAGGTSVFVPCDDALKISARALSKAITHKTRWLILNSPNNPSGAVYSLHELREIADVLAQNPNIWILSDDIYQPLTYETHFTSILKADPSLRLRTLLVNGLSKSYAMTGWRLGYGVGPTELIEAMTTLQSQSTSGVSCITQAAALAAMSHDHTAFLEQQRQHFWKRRDLFLKALQPLKGLSYQVPEGAFYLFARCTDWLQSGGYSSDIALAQDILEKAHVSCVPGTEFGLPGYLRFSYAIEEAALETAAQRLISLWRTSQ